MNKSILFVAMFFCVLISFSQDELNAGKVDPYDCVVPDPLTFFSGDKIRSQEEWIKKRRPEILEFFTENVYGKIPGKLEISSVEIVEQSNNALSGKAKRRQVKLNFNNNGIKNDFTVLIYLPLEVKNAPVFLGYNFHGNHTVTGEREIVITKGWYAGNELLDDADKVNPKKSRGSRIGRWPVEKIIDAGFGLATLYRGDVDPDKVDYSDGIQPLLYTKGQKEPADNEWGNLAVWAWGLSRVMDYFELENEIDESKVIVIGHSRMGKTALWAGATDERFAAVVSNNSGCGGAALSKRKYGETVARINEKYPHWFCKNFRVYNNNEESLPVDQHELIALIAPRPVYVASAFDDRWSDPRGEFLSAFYATPVYELYGKQGIPSKQMPEVNQPVQNTVAYHIRTGEHDIKTYDWEQYIKWAQKELKVVAPESSQNIQKQGSNNEK
jgi:hypothetical protein